MALPTNRIDLEMQKFVEDAGGNVAVRTQLTVQDIHIGQVELKDGATDTFAKVKSDGTDNALKVLQQTLPVGTNIIGKIRLVSADGTEITEDTHSTAQVSIHGMVAYDSANNLIWSRHTDGTNFMPTGDTSGRSIYTKATQEGIWDIGTVTAITDITNEIDVDLTASTSFGSDNALGSSSAKYSMQEHFEATTSWSESAGATNLATTTTHFGQGNNFLTFDKQAGNVIAMISKTISAFDMNEYDVHSIGHMHCYVPSLTDVVNIFVRLGTDASNYHEWSFPVANLTAGWNDIDTPISNSDSQTGVGYNLSAITWIAYGVEFSAADDTLAGMITGGWAVKRVLASTSITTSTVQVNSPFLIIKDRNSNTRLDIGGGGTYNFLYNQPTDGTNLMPMMDAIARHGHMELTTAPDATYIGDIKFGESLPSGTNAIGKLAANSGVDIGDVDVTSISPGDNTIGGVMSVGGDGAKSDSSLTLTNQSQAYANTAPATPHLLIVHNASDTDVYFRFTTGTTLGTLLESGKSLTIDMGASEVLYFYCPTAAGKIINYGTRANY